MGEYDLGGKPVVYILFNLQHTPSTEYMKMEMTVLDFDTIFCFVDLTNTGPQPRTMAHPVWDLPDEVCTPYAASIYASTEILSPILSTIPLSLVFFTYPRIR